MIIFSQTVSQTDAVAERVEIFKLEIPHTSNQYSFMKGRTVSRTPMTTFSFLLWKRLILTCLRVFVVFGTIIMEKVKISKYSFYCTSQRLYIRYSGTGSSKFLNLMTTSHT